MENNLLKGTVYKWINEDGAYVIFEKKGLHGFCVDFYNANEKINIIFYANFVQCLDIANELVFNHKLQLC
jgi:hypothetical protein